MGMDDMELSFRNDLNIFVEEDGFLTHLILRLRSLPEVPKINRLHLCFNEKFFATLAGWDHTIYQLFQHTLGGLLF